MTGWDVPVPDEPGPDEPDPDESSPDERAELAELAELVGVVEQLDEDNERLRVRVLELLELMEDAVTAQVAAERRADELAARVAALDAELAAVRNTRVMRATAPLRAAYARFRQRGGGADREVVP